MKLLKNERALTRWLVTDGSSYPRDIKRGDYKKPLSYPCYGYLILGSFQYEELEPAFLYAHDLARMLKQIGQES